MLNLGIFRSNAYILFLIDNPFKIKIVVDNGLVADDVYVSRLNPVMFKIVLEQSVMHKINKN